MQAQLIGLQPLNFKNQSGETICGVNIFVAFPDVQVEGLKCERFFLKDGMSLPKDTKLNDKIELVFDYKGKIEGIYKAN